MSYRHLVQIGRVAWVAYGRNEGKLCTILNIIDNNRALVEGPYKCGVKRQSLPFKQLRLTKFKLRVPMDARTKTIRKVWDKEEVQKKWTESSTAKKMEAKKKRRQMNDFDRFKLSKAKQALNKEVRREFFKLKAKGKVGKVGKAPPKPKKAAAPKGKGKVAAKPKK